MEKILNCVMRGILGTIAMYFINAVLEKAGVSVSVGINAATVLTSGNPWISWAYGTLRDRILQTFVDFLQKVFFCVLPIAILAGCGYNSLTT